MARPKAVSGDDALHKSFHSSEVAIETIVKNLPYTVHPFVAGRYLTTAGIQWSTITTGSTGITSGSSAVVTHAATTINWPGLDGEYVDEMEAGLTMAFAASATGSTGGFVWEMKDSDGSTWTIISSAAKWQTTKAWKERTNSGYVKLGTGYNKLPLHLRLKAWNKLASKIQVKIKNSSYVRIKPKKV